MGFAVREILGDYLTLFHAANGEPLARARADCLVSRINVETGC
jgi:hypothetical protein